MFTLSICILGITMCVCYIAARFFENYSQRACSRNEERDLQLAMYKAGSKYSQSGKTKKGAVTNGLQR